MRRDLLVAPLHLRVGPGRPSCRLRLRGFAGLSLLIGLGPRLARLPVTLRSNGVDVNLVLSSSAPVPFTLKTKRGT